MYEPRLHGDDTRGASVHRWLYAYVRGFGKEARPHLRIKYKIISKFNPEVFEIEDLDLEMVLPPVIINRRPRSVTAASLAFFVLTGVKSS